MKVRYDLRKRRDPWALPGSEEALLTAMGVARVRGGIALGNQSAAQHVDRVVILLDLNETVAFTPWLQQGSSTTEIEGSCAHCSMLPIGRSGYARGHELRMYHRPGVAAVLHEMLGRCVWGFYTTKYRRNALCMYDQKCIRTCLER